MTVPAVRRADGKMLVNPHDDVVLNAGDTLIVLGALRSRSGRPVSSRQKAAGSKHYSACCLLPTVRGTLRSVPAANSAAPRGRLVGWLGSGQSCASRGC